MNEHRYIIEPKQSVSAAMGAALRRWDGRVCVLLSLNSLVDGGVIGVEMFDITASISDYNGATFYRGGHP